MPAVNSYTGKNTELKIQTILATPESKISSAFLAWYMSFLCSMHYASSKLSLQASYFKQLPKLQIFKVDDT